MAANQARQRAHEKPRADSMRRPELPQRRGGREIVQDRSRLRTFWKIESLFLKSEEVFTLLCDSTFDKNSVPPWTRGEIRGVFERLSLPQRERRLGSGSRSLCVSASLRLS